MVKINVIAQESATIVEVAGEVDLYSSPEVRTTLIQLTEDKTPVIIIDLREVSYMDSSGVATLVEGLQAMGTYNGKFILVNLRDEVKLVFELSRLDKVFEIYDSLEKALKHI